MGEEPPREPTVRVVVVEARSPRCGLVVGDYFEAAGSSLRLPTGRPFCLSAMASALPLLALRMEDQPAASWLERKPYVCCPEPTGGVLMRMDRIDRAAEHGGQP